jgi:hypothetical protein
VEDSAEVWVAGVLHIVINPYVDVIVTYSIATWSCCSVLVHTLRTKSLQKLQTCVLSSGGVPNSVRVQLHN